MLVLTPCKTDDDMFLHVLANPGKFEFEGDSDFLQDISASDPRQLEQLRRFESSTNVVNMRLSVTAVNAT